eukprot:3244843-Amphidinium_carterae.1
MQKVLSLAVGLTIARPDMIAEVAWVLLAGRQDWNFNPPLFAIWTDYDGVGHKRRSNKLEEELS